MNARNANTPRSDGQAAGWSTTHRGVDRALRAVAVVYLVAIAALVAVYKESVIEVFARNPFFAAYGALVSGYILSRFLLSLLYRDAHLQGLEPHVAVVVPAFNEEAAIYASIEALLALDYPADKLDVVVVDDGSTDGTAKEIERARAGSDGRVRAIQFEHNRGKRAAMARGIRETTAEIIAFVDSDSVLEPEALRKLVQRFADARVGAACGHADVLNPRESLVTRMQAVRYYVAFRVVKAAESVFGAVTCCSGCFAAYRREAIVPHLSVWEHQRFMGAPATVGDDRSLTNVVLRDWRVVYEARAISHTIVPATLRGFLRQQTRWKRSWTRESLIVARFIWRKNPVAAVATYAAVLLPLVAPIAAVRALLWLPLHGAGAPLIYLAGLYSLALMYGLYYAARHRPTDALWLWGVAFVFFYLVFLLWQTYYAAITANRTTWGTRAATHALPEGSA
jgi:hyaluronan synthase